MYVWGYLQGSENGRVVTIADGTCPEDNRKLNRFEIESDEQCEQWLLTETIGSRSIQSEHKAVSNWIELT